MLFPNGDSRLWRLLRKTAGLSTQETARKCAFLKILVRQRNAVVS